MTTVFVASGILPIDMRLGRGLAVHLGALYQLPPTKDDSPLPILSRGVLCRLPLAQDKWDRASVGLRVEMATGGSGVSCPGERGCSWVGSGGPPEVTQEAVWSDITTNGMEGKMEHG